MDAARAAAGRRRAEMREEAPVFAPATAAPGVIHGNELEECVIRHLADADRLRVFRAKVLDEALRPLVHVARRAVHVATDDVEEVRVHTVLVDHLGDPSLEEVAPRVGAEVHVAVSYTHLTLPTS